MKYCKICGKKLNKNFINYNEKLVKRIMNMQNAL
jgi:hypothetical protein